MSVLKKWMNLMKSWLFPEKELPAYTPSLHFQNGQAYYSLRIQIPESMVDDLHTEIYPDFIIIRWHTFYRRIYFYQPVDAAKLKKWYSSGVFSMEIPKREVSPEERLNRWTLAMGM